MKEPSSGTQPVMTWRTAWTWGVGAAVIHRLILLVWIAGVWFFIAQPNGLTRPHSDPKVPLPPLSTSLEQAVFGTWRHWDVIHYLNLAQNGYRAVDPGPTVFPPLTPALLAAADWLLPGGLDLAAMVVETLVFGVALAVLFQFCVVYYRDVRLAKRVVVAMTLLPGAFLFHAPLSESLYLVAAVGMFYWAIRERWHLAAGLVALATLARSQGVLLGGVLFLMLVQASWRNRDSWRARLDWLLRHGWSLVLVPAVFLGFQVFRSLYGLPSLDTVYANYSYVFFVDPLHGLWINIRWLVEHPATLLWDFDMWALLYMLVSCVVMLRSPRHALLPLVVFTFSHVLLFVTKINWVWGMHDQVIYSQSLARYSLILFPLVIMWVDHIRRRSGSLQWVIIFLLVVIQLVLSALNTLGGGLV
ncbi:MAG: hypothetical protein H6672_07930 [Anaerolineaceae bacterium]|nr:hypothetical protein [Anaerolineaceae bacterium]